jgi:cation-transporting P-type ATPase F
MKDWHAVSVEEIASSLETDIYKGLEERDARLRQEKFGSNTITMRKRKHPLFRFVHQFREPLMYILVLAGVVTAFLEEWVDSSVIFGVVMINATVGFIQETRAGKALEALMKMVTTEATVVRSGSKKRISSVHLVPGDIVMVQSGDKVPADLRLFKTRELRIDESALTGESVAVEKRTDTLMLSTVLADRKNIAYSGTLVTSGQGRGLVVATGDNTQTGQISESILTAQEIATPLTRKIARFSKVLLYFIIALSAAAFVVGLARNATALEETFLSAVALAVAAIPEGLPAAITITLAIGVSRMARRHAIIRKLPAVETLGSTTVICSDKTGTLTENQMTVTEIYAGLTGYRVSGTGYQPEGMLSREDGSLLQDSRSLTECLTAGLLCNDSHLLQEDGQWKSSGDPTEVALIVSARKAGLSEDNAARRFSRIDSIPFESHLQYMATLHATGDRNIVYVKGAVEKLSRMCTFLAIDGQEGLTQARLSPDDVEKILEKAKEMGGKGLRVLAFARKEVSSTKRVLTAEEVDSGLIFLGLQAMLDPPRQDAITAVQTCQKAGIRVKMITGDNVHTATMIAQQIGLNNHLRDGDSDAVIAVTGYELHGYSDLELAQVVDRANVFARVSPEQKLQLVRQLQEKGHIVAVTGDGVNDAPALRQADIGIAMGVRGTDVAKEAADMVLTDDNFASIESAVEEGRGIFDNLTKFITWTLPTNFGEALIIITAIFAGLTLPMLPVQILWINMTTALALGMMLIFEPKEADIMGRKPRKPNSPILGRALVERVVMVSGMILAGAFGLFIWEQSNGTSLDEARTVAVNAIIMVELLYLLNSRSLSKSMFQVGLLSNKWVMIGIAAMIALQVAYTYSPAMNSLFKSAPISAESWLRILGVAFLTYVIVEIEKWARGKLSSRKILKTMRDSE